MEEKSRLINLKSQLNQLLNDCSEIIKKHVSDPQTRLDFESRIFAERLKNDLLLTRKYLTKNTKNTILDIGCGKGHISLLLASLGFSVCGIDIEKTKGEQLELQKNKWQKNIWQELESSYRCFTLKYLFYDGRKIPFCDKSFDAVMAYAVIEHVDDIDKFLLETNRILRNGGLLFIFMCPRKQAVIEHIARLLKLPHHEKLVDERDMIEKLNINRFQIMNIKHSDLIPAFPPLQLQTFWNHNFKVLVALDSLFLKTSLKYISHHVNIVSKKIDDC